MGYRNAGEQQLKQEESLIVFHRQDGAEMTIRGVGSFFLESPSASSGFISSHKTIQNLTIPSVFQPVRKEKGQEKGIISTMHPFKTLPKSCTL